ncbi:MAG TPA: SDR family oxidoreductase [Kofleriaceae bacterium]|jgi:NAD(P)-dependent dehydrogenase (short-subunit alcohol dehydrogenase family)|nr:SDR family oxidoreductase [Kofleriaceae bacterium]
MTTSKTILITGATAGIGRTTALHLASRGHRVIASGRKSDQLASLREEAQKAGASIDTVLLDVTRAESIELAVSEVDRITGGRGVDVLVNNAGYGLVGPLSEVTDADLRKQYDTNVFGLMAVTRAFLPAMRERRSGRIVNVSSMGGRMTFPFMGAYNSTKYAVESLSDALRAELQPFGIQVSLIEPGVIRTNFADTSMTFVDQYKDSPYKGAIAKAQRMRDLMEKTASGPQVIAKAIRKAVERRRPAARYVAPFSTWFALLIKVLLPTRAWDWTMRRFSFLTHKHLGMTGAPAAKTSRPSGTHPSVRAA